jgi:hypothetical protein
MKLVRAGFIISVLLILLLAGVFISICRGQTLNPANQITLSAQGQQSDKFTAPDLTVNYTYTRTDGDMQITGTVQFGMNIQGNYAVVQTFQLGLALADAQGNVLRQQGLTTAFDSNVGDAINFSTTVTVPAQAASMAFTYTGQAYSGGSGGATNFWFSPFNN